MQIKIPTTKGHNVSSQKTIGTGGVEHYKKAKPKKVKGVKIIK